MAATPGRAAGGSSPLARGLLKKCLSDLRAGRIIPARAGFTTRCSRPCVPGRDHPRSRGVYREACGRPSGHLRIIPARAGFTLPAGSPVRSCRDHPRSRGVYQSAATGVPGAAGSSPLARGLLASRHGGRAGGGIIPARAGFTFCFLPLTRGVADHPRSRGVYDPSSATRPATAGSSPLARGLPAQAQRPARSAGIIPARAGFTKSIRTFFENFWDHPRSRGVYLPGPP